MIPRSIFRIVLTALAAVALLSLVACRHFYEAPYVPYVDKDQRHADVIRASYALADKLHEQVNGTLSKDAPFLVASFVDVDDLRRSSTLGRIMAQQIGSRFSQLGWKIIDVTLRTSSIFVEETKGEFLLSRDLKAISTDHDASKAIVGTYAVAEDRVYVSARVINVTDNAVLAGADEPVDIFPGDALLR